MVQVCGLNSDGSVEKQMKHLFELSVWISRLHEEIDSCNQAIDLTSEGRLCVIELIKDCKCLIRSRDSVVGIATSYGLDD
jgi:hypothetical protein